MSLYSSDTLSSVGEDNQAEANHGSVSEREILSVYDNESPWFYLFTHCSKMEQVLSTSSSQFTVWRKNSLYENLIISYIVKYAKLYYFCDTI